MDTNVNLINNFFQRFDLTDVELKLKQKCQTLKQELDSISNELNTKRSELVQKEEDVKALTYRLDSLLQFVLEVETERVSKLTK